MECLSEPLVAFIRLQKALLLGELTEVCVPTRFIFIQLGPVGNQQRYHEVGRSIATLMSDEVITLRAKLSGTVYCYRSCLFVCVCGFVCLFVGLLPP